MSNRQWRPDNSVQCPYCKHVFDNADLCARLSDLCARLVDSDGDCLHVDCECGAQIEVHVESIPDFSRTSAKPPTAPAEEKDDDPDPLAWVEDSPWAEEGKT